MRKTRTPRNWRRFHCGTPVDNHEVVFEDGPFVCRSPECNFLGDQDEGIAHVIANQFEPERPRNR